MRDAVQVCSQRTVPVGGRCWNWFGSHWSGSRGCQNLARQTQGCNLECFAGRRQQTHHQVFIARNGDRFIYPLSGNSPTPRCSCCVVFWHPINVWIFSFFWCPFLGAKCSPFLAPFTVPNQWEYYQCQCVTKIKSNEFRKIEFVHFQMSRYSTFLSIYKEKWSDILKFRQKSMLLAKG